MPTTGQLLLLGLSVVLLLVGGQISLARIWRPTEGLRVAAKGCMYLGITAAFGVIVWHSMTRRLCPLNDNFASLVLLAVLLGAFVMYVQRMRPLAGLDWFVMPIVILLLVVAGVFGRVDYHSYQPLLGDAWLWVHRTTTYAGAAGFAVAAACGAMYIVSSRRLRQKKPLVGFASLERLERMTMHSVTLGFALLTVGLITGFLRMYQGDQQPPLAKILLASLAWLIYAIVIHAPINPRFRGRRVAVLSVAGFVLIIGVVVVVQFMPGGAH